LVLSTLITSKSRIELLTWFVVHPGERFHYLQLSKILRASRPSIQNELKRLEEGGILLSKKEANVRFYWVNQEHPLYPELKSIVFKTAGVAEFLREALHEIGDVRAVFIYGSVAKNQEDARSDIDLMFIGNTDQQRLDRVIASAEIELRREINCSVYELEDWKRQLSAGKSFVTDVATGPKIFLVGSDDDLR
jgi:predicted nucleotidyltransferase